MFVINKNNISNGDTIIIGISECCSNSDAEEIRQKLSQLFPQINILVLPSELIDCIQILHNETNYISSLTDISYLQNYNDPSKYNYNIPVSSVCGIKSDDSISTVKTNISCDMGTNVDALTSLQNTVNTIVTDAKTTLT